MSYSLRPGNKLKHPVRYQSESDDDDLDAIAEPRNDMDATQSGFQALSAYKVDLQSQSPTQSYPTLTSRSAPTSKPTSHTAPYHPSPSAHTEAQRSPQQLRKMANVRHVRKRLHSARDKEPSKRSRDRSPTAQPDGGQAASRATQGTHSSTSIFTHPKPAAFPSLPTDEPAPKTSILDRSRHIARAIMDSMEKSNKKAITACECLVDSMYNTTDFPDHVDEKERTWYVELKARWAANETASEVSQTPRPLIELLCDLHSDDRSRLPPCGHHYVRPSSSRSTETFPKARTTTHIIQSDAFSVFLRQLSQ